MELNINQYISKIQLDQKPIVFNGNYIQLKFHNRGPLGDDRILNYEEIYTY